MTRAIDERHYLSGLHEQPAPSQTWQVAQPSSHVHALALPLADVIPTHQQLALSMALDALLRVLVIIVRCEPGFIWLIHVTNGSLMTHPWSEDCPLRRSCPRAVRAGSARSACRSAFPCRFNSDAFKGYGSIGQLHNRCGGWLKTAIDIEPDRVWFLALAVYRRYHLNLMATRRCRPRRPSPHR